MWQRSDKIQCVPKHLPAQFLSVQQHSSLKCLVLCLWNLNTILSHYLVHSNEYANFCSQYIILGLFALRTNFRIKVHIGQRPFLVADVQCHVIGVSQGLTAPCCQKWLMHVNYLSLCTKNINYTESKDGQHPILNLLWIWGGRKTSRPYLYYKINMHPWPVTVSMAKVRPHRECWGLEEQRCLNLE